MPSVPDGYFVPTHEGLPQDPLYSDLIGLPSPVMVDLCYSINPEKVIQLSTFKHRVLCHRCLQFIKAEASLSVGLLMRSFVQKGTSLTKMDPGSTPRWQQG